MNTRDTLQQLFHKVSNPAVRLLVRAGVTPNMVTATGLVLNIVACVVLIYGATRGVRGDLVYVGWAGFLILFAGLFDLLDGQVARLGKGASRYGALFDSVLDRYSELIVLFGCCYYLILQGYFLSSLLGFVALVGSMMTSYVRARAEGLGIECKGGSMQRPERVVLIGTGALASGVYSAYSAVPLFEPVLIFVVPLAVVAVFSNVTAVGRVRHCRRELT